MVVRISRRDGVLAEEPERLGGIDRDAVGIVLRWLVTTKPGDHRTYGGCKRIAASVGDAVVSRRRILIEVVVVIGIRGIGRPGRRNRCRDAGDGVPRTKLPGTGRRLWEERGERILSYCKG